MTWTGDALRIADDNGNDIYAFPDPADLTTFTFQNLPLTGPGGMAWSGDSLFIADVVTDDLFTFPDPDDTESSGAFTRQELPAGLTFPIGSTFIPSTIPARIQVELATGVPEVVARVRTSTPGQVRIQTELTTGVPEVVARVRATSADDRRISTELTTGIPQVTARVRTTAPADAAASAGMFIVDSAGDEVFSVP